MKTQYILLFLILLLSCNQKKSEIKELNNKSKTEIMVSNLIELCGQPDRQGTSPNGTNWYVFVLEKKKTTPDNFKWTIDKALNILPTDKENNGDYLGKFIYTWETPLYKVVMKEDIIGDINWDAIEKSNLKDQITLWVTNK